MTSSIVARTLFAGALALSLSAALVPGARAANPGCTTSQRADQEQLGQYTGPAQKADQEQLGAQGNRQFAMNSPARC